MYCTMSSAASSSLIFFFPFWIPTSYLSCASVVARASTTMLNKSDQNGHSFLVSSLRGNVLSLSPLFSSVGLSFTISNFPQFVVIHTVKGFSVVNEAEIDVFSGILLLFL